MIKLHSGFWAILGGAFIYGSFGILTRYMDIGFGNFTQVLVRALIASLIALVIIFINKNNLKFKKSDYIKMVLLGTAYFFGTTAFTIGNISTKVSVMIFMLYVGSFTTTFLLSTFVFKEKITLTKVFSVAIVIIGMLITFNFKVTDLAFGAFLGIFAGITDAFGNAIRKKLADISKEVVIGIQFIIATILALIAIIVSQEQMFKEINLFTITIAVVFGIVLVMINRLLMIGFKKIDFTLGQIVLSTEIFFATVLAVILFFEIPTLNEIIGGLLIFIGATLVNFKLEKILKLNFKKA